MKDTSACTSECLRAALESAAWASECLKAALESQARLAAEIADLKARLVQVEGDAYERGYSAGRGYEPY